MAPFDENALRRSLESGERRLALARQRRRQQKRVALALFLVVLLLVPLVAAMIEARRRAPAAPLLVVTWPKPKVRQVIASGATILPRAGQPFVVEVLDGEKWEVTWNAGDVESHSPSLRWAPAGRKATLLVHCKAISGDWTRFFRFLWPAREVSLFAAAATHDGDYQRALEAPPQGVWIYPRIVATGNVGWDERALPLLYAQGQVVPKNELAGAMAEIKAQTSSPLWQIVSDFEGANRKPSADGATFAALQDKNVEASLPRAGAAIAHKMPLTSVKFVLRLDKQPPQGVLRLAFDGKGERKAWIRRPGEAGGGPFAGWEGGEPAGTLAPSLPRLPG